MPKPSHEEMREMIAGLSDAERAMLRDPQWITEDEADIILSKRAMKEPGRNIPAEEIFREFGQPRHRKRIA